jgi:hypothetical protein
MTKDCFGPEFTRNVMGQPGPESSKAAGVQLTSFTCMVSCLRGRRNGAIEICR